MYRDILKIFNEIFINICELLKIIRFLGNINKIEAIQYLSIK